MSAAVLKAQGNAHFAKKEWESAIESYSQALEAEKDPVASAALLSNRSAAYVHLDRLEEGERLYSPAAEGNLLTSIVSQLWPMRDFVSIANLLGRRVTLG